MTAATELGPENVRVTFEETMTPEQIEGIRLMLVKHIRESSSINPLTEASALYKLCEQAKRASLATGVVVPREPDEDAKLLDWAETHPELAMSELRSWWTTCGPGGREIRFEFRNIIRDAALTASPAGDKEGK